MLAAGGGWQQLTLSASSASVILSTRLIPKMPLSLLSDCSSMRLDVSYSNVDRSFRAMQSATLGYSDAPRPSTRSYKICLRAQARSTSMMWPWCQSSDAAILARRLFGCSPSKPSWMVWITCLSSQSADHSTFGGRMASRPSNERIFERLCRATGKKPHSWLDGCYNCSRCQSLSATIRYQSAFVRRRRQAAGAWRHPEIDCRSRRRPIPLVGGRTTAPRRPRQAHDALQRVPLG